MSRSGFRQSRNKSAFTLALNRFSVVLVSVSGWLLTMPTVAAETDAVKLVWRLEPGEQLRIRMTHRLQTEMRIGEKQTVLSMLSAMELWWHVRQPTPSGAMQIDQTFQRLILQSSEPDGTLHKYDSAAPDSVPQPLREIADSVKPLLNGRISITLSPQGEIQAVQVPAETDSLLRGVPAFAGWKNLLTRDGIDRMLRQSLGRLPDKPVVAGDVWEDLREIDSPAGKMKLTSRYEYRGRVTENGRPLELIHRRTSMQRIDPQAGAFDEPPTLPDRQDSGTLYFDSARGRLARSHGRQEMTSELPMAAGRMRVSSTGTLDTVIEMLTNR